MSIVDIARAVAPDAKHKIIGIRPGEKIHEQMIGVEDAPHTYEFAGYYKILPAIYDWSKSVSRINGGKPVSDFFSYSSDSNTEWMKIEELQAWLATQNGKFLK